MEIQHPLHQHPLVLRENLGSQLTCDLCRSHRETAFFYYCVQCKGPYFCLHYACAVTLPQQLNHPFHPHHPLALLTGRDYTCPICMVNHRSGSDLYMLEPQHPNYSSYTCTECNFDMHLDCAMFPSIVYYQGHDHIQQPLCHLQHMALVEKVDGECFVCRLPCDPSGSAFACTICKYLIHKSCSELPSEITHPFHPECHLFLRANHRKYACRSCEKQSYTFVFRCDSCNFNICVACSSLRPTIEYEGHDHLLCFVEMDRIPGLCKAHHADCRQSVVVELLSCKQPCNILRCVQCAFDVHILCGPLPRTIKHKCHVHPLTLFDLVIEDDSGEYYCDACEMRRNPQLRVYYCTKCKFIADVYCVLSEVCLCSFV